MIQFDYCNIFQMGWNHQLVFIKAVLYKPLFLKGVTLGVGWRSPWRLRGVDQWDAEGSWELGTKKKTNDILTRKNHLFLMSFLILFHIISCLSHLIFQIKIAIWGRIINKLYKKSNVTDSCNLHRKEIPHAVSGETRKSPAARVEHQKPRLRRRSQLVGLVLMGWSYWYTWVVVWNISDVHSTKLGKASFFWLAHIFFRWVGSITN